MSRQASILLTIQDLYKVEFVPLTNVLLFNVGSLIEVDEDEANFEDAKLLTNVGVIGEGLTLGAG